jgi:hypothetical protein
MKTIKQIKDQVREEYPVNYYQEAYEAVFDAELQIEWLKTEEAIKLNGEDICKERIEENQKGIKKAKVKLDFIKKHYKLK